MTTPTAWWAACSWVPCLEEDAAEAAVSWAVSLAVAVPAVAVPPRDGKVRNTLCLKYIWGDCAAVAPNVHIRLNFKFELSLLLVQTYAYFQTCTGSILKII